MSFYEVNLTFFVIANAALFWLQHRRRQKANPPGDNAEAPSLDSEKIKRVDSLLEPTIIDETSKHNADTLIRTYTIAFLFASAGDWMQGPLIYAVYKYDKGLEERLVAALFACGFISAAVSSSVVGQMADRYGRKMACMAYCALYCTSCFCIFSSALPVLFVGRALGGLCATLLYSVFDAWMITEFHSRDLESSGSSLASLFGRISSLNCIVAIISGVVGQAITATTGSRQTPFILSAILFGVTGWYIQTNWSENHGRSAGIQETGASSSLSTSAWKIWQDKRVLALATTTALFESMMYMLIFYWTSAINDARQSRGEGKQSDPPLGIIFACFMCAMMAGSNIFMSGSKRQTVSKSLYTLKITLSLSSIWLMTTVLTSREDMTFYALCLVELCIGLYFPSINFLKSQIIEDDFRGGVYSLMRLPLNGLVIVAQSLAHEGKFHRNNVFLAFGGGLLLAVLALHGWIKA